MCDIEVWDVEVWDVQVWDVEVWDSMVWEEGFGKGVVGKVQNVLSSRAAAGLEEVRERARRGSVPSLLGWVLVLRVKGVAGGKLQWIIPATFNYSMEA